MPETKLLCVLPSLNGGGAERAAITLLGALDQARYTSALYLFTRDGPYSAELPGNLRTYVAPESLGRVQRVWQLAATIRRTMPDIVVSFLNHLTVIAAAKLSGAKPIVVFSQQNPIGPFLRDPDYSRRRKLPTFVVKQMCRLAFTSADACVAPCEELADELRREFGVGSSGLRVIGNPIDLNRVRQHAADDCPELTRGRDEAVVVTVGRLVHQKNHRLLLHAFLRLRQRLKASLFIIGEGPMRERIIEEIMVLGLEESVRLIGFQNNPWRFVARSTVFVLTSDYEGFGNVIVEAMACGVPVVSTASSGGKGIVEDGRNGLLVRRQGPDVLASALEKVLTSSSLRQELADGARSTAERFSSSTVAREYESLFQDLLSRREFRPQSHNRANPGAIA